MFKWIFNCAVLYEIGCVGASRVMLSQQHTGGGLCKASTIINCIAQLSLLAKVDARNEPVWFVPTFPVNVSSLIDAPTCKSNSMYVTAWKVLNARFARNVWTGMGTMAPLIPSSSQSSGHRHPRSMLQLGSMMPRSWEVHTDDKVTHPNPSVKHPINYYLRRVAARFDFFFSICMAWAWRPILFSKGW